MNAKHRENNLITSKLKSQKGVSILFALLVLLVCTVVASIILTASTTTSGRTSDLEKMDQRYYSVSSAVNFMRDSYDGVTLKVDKYEKVVSKEITTVNETTGDVTTDTTENKSYQFVFKRPADNLFLLEDAILCYAFGKDGELPSLGESYSQSDGWITGEAAKTSFEANMPVLNQEMIRELNLTHDPNKITGSQSELLDEAGTSFNVAITSTLTPGGDLCLLFVNNNGDKDKYKATLNLDAKKDDIETSEVIDKNISTTTSDGNTITTVETVQINKKSTTIKWTAGAMKKL